MPFAGKRPAALNINGHRLLILATSRGVFEDSLELVGADRVKKVRAGGSHAENEEILNRLARSVDAGVVIAPAAVEVSQVIRNLEDQLPWVQ